MKRFLSILIIAVMVLSFASCGSSSDNDGGNAGNNKGKAEITETTIVDEAGVKITAKSLEADGLTEPALKLLIENNSGKNLTVQCRNASINGYMMYNLMSVDVADGKSANDELVFLNSHMEDCGIEEIADMGFSFYIFTTEDWETYLETPQITVLTSLAEDFEYEYDNSGIIMYDDNGIEVMVKGLDENTFLGASVKVYIANNTDKDITIQTRNVSINNFMIDPMFSTDILSGKHAISDITFLSSELEANEIAEIKTLELNLHIFDSTTWETILETDTITIHF